LLFYFGGQGGETGKNETGNATGLAVLRRDGFASMDGTGVLTTRPVRIDRGKILFVNADVRGGELRAEVLDENNEIIKVKAPAPTDKPGAATTNTVEVALSKEKFIAVANVDFTLAQGNWEMVPDLSILRGRTVKFRFYITNGKFYSFWVSQTGGFCMAGASGGFVAAGGPQFVMPVDSVGNASYRPVTPPPAPTNSVPTNAAPGAPK